MRLCWEFTSGDFLLRDAKAEFTESLQFTALARNVQQALVNYVDISEDDIEAEENVLTCKTLYLNTVKYAIKGCFVVDLVETEQVPVFFKVSNIINFRSKCLLCGSIWKSNAFNAHVHSFEVEAIGIWCIIEAGQEIDYHALDMYTLGETKIITLNHKPYKS